MWAKSPPTSFISLYQTSLLSAIHTIILANYHQYKRTQKADGQHLLFHISNHPFIKFPGGVLMKNPTLILTEQRQSNDKSPISTIIQQAITVWLTKELSK